MAVAAMLSVQLGSALSVELISTVGAAGTAWLRLTMGASILIAIARPPLRSVRRRNVPALISLGVTTGLVTVMFLAAIDRIPLGTAVAIEFLGPLTVAAIRSNSTRALTWPGLALVGVILLTEPWQGNVNLLGVGFAACAGVGWATYILLTQHIGDRFSGIQALSLTIPVAAFTAALIGVPQAFGHITFEVLAASAGLSILHPVLPYALEMLALKRMTSTAFGTLMSLEPAIGVILGVIILNQSSSVVQGIGFLLVVSAGAAAQRKGKRPPAINPDQDLSRPDLIN